MDQKILKGWIKALRSGKYKQTKDVHLHIGRSFNAFGVLLDSQYDAWWKKRTATGTKGWYLVDENNQPCTHLAIEELGLSERIIRDVDELTGHWGYCFTRLAAWLEKTYVR